jgi:hypothetical protein
MMGVDSEVFEVLRWENREFSMSCDVIVKKTKLACRITIVYGASEDENKQYFIEELHNLLVGRTEATIIEGGGGGGSPCKVPG